MRFIVLALVACGAAVVDPVSEPRSPTASEQVLTPAIITTEEWTGTASVICAAGIVTDGKRSRLNLWVAPDRCIPRSYPDISAACDATPRGERTLELTVTYRFDRAPPYRRPSDDCDQSGRLLCSIEAPAPGNYVVRLGDLALPVTVGYGNSVGPCTNGEDQ